MMAPLPAAGNGCPGAARAVRWLAFAWPGPRGLVSRVRVSSAAPRPPGFLGLSRVVVSFSSRHGKAIPGLADTPPPLGGSRCFTSKRRLAKSQISVQIVKSADVRMATCTLPIGTPLRPAASGAAPSRTLPFVSNCGCARTTYAHTTSLFVSMCAVVAD